MPSFFLFGYTAMTFGYSTRSIDLPPFPVNKQMCKPLQRVLGFEPRPLEAKVQQRIPMESKMKLAQRFIYCVQINARARHCGVTQNFRYLFLKHMTQ